MSKPKLFPICFIFTVGLIVFHSGDRTALAQAKSDPAPSFTLKLLNGKDFESSDLKGKSGDSKVCGFLLTGVPAGGSCRGKNVPRF